MGEAVGIANDSGEPRGGALNKLTGKAIFGWLNDIFAGSVCGMLSVLFGISYAALMADHPALTQALLTYVITVMGERLRFASQAIGILQN